jgi:hypothetical protein
MPGQDALVDRCDLGSDSAVLPRQHIKNTAHGRRKTPVVRVRNQP